MIYSLDKLRELIPLYLNQRLAENKRKEFEEALGQYPELKLELKEFSEIKEIYKEIEKEIPPPSGVLYQKVLENIQPQIKLSLIPEKKSYLEQIREFLKWVLGSPRVSWGIAAVQFAIILALVITLPKGDGFRTSTSTEPLAGGGIKINVIFDKGSTEQEIRGVLNKVGATIVGGPSNEGLYIIKVKEDQDVEQTLKELKKTNVVQFAEKAY
jgi:hypothetical protein